MVCPETQRALVSSRAWNAVPSFWTSFHANRSTSAVWRHFTQSRHVKQQCLSRGIFHRQQAQKNMCRPFAWVVGKEHNTLDPRYQRFTRFRISCKHFIITFQQPQTTDLETMESKCSAKPWRQTRHWPSFSWAVSDNETTHVRHTHQQQIFL